MRVGYWGAVGFGALNPEQTMRLVIPSAVAIILAFQMIYGAFFVSVLDIRALRLTPEAALSPAARNSMLLDFQSASPYRRPESGRGKCCARSGHRWQDRDILAPESHSAAGSE